MLKVFPCDINKHPLIKDWQTLATNDPAQIEMWRQLFRERFTHFGLPTGPLNGILALDIDVKRENGFETLQAKNLKVPATLCQNTISGGRHYLFKYPSDGQRYGNRTGLYPGVDVRGDGGFIVIYELDSTPIAPPPAWLLSDSLKTPQQAPGTPISLHPEIAQGMIQKCLQAISEASPGERNNTLNREAFRIGQLVSAGSITREYADSILQQAGKAIGLDAGEIRATTASAIGGGHTKPMTSPFNAPPSTAGLMIPPPPSVEKWTPSHTTFFELLDTSQLKKPQIFEHWSNEDVTLTVGDGGSGKSTMKLYEAVCLALGASFLGFPCKQAGKTLYITGEDSEKKLKAMLGQILTDMALLRDEKALNIVLDSILIKKDDDMCLITKDKQGFIKPNLLAMDKIREAVQEIKPKLVVIDPIASFWGSESSVNDMGSAVSKFASKLANENNCCVEMINHAGKESSNKKDMSQFAGRGGTGLVSHVRVGRMLRGIDETEYTELTGNALTERQSAMVVNVNKFSDGSPLYNKQFVVLRDGYLFTRIMIDSAKVRIEKQEDSDGERVLSYIKDERAQGKWPTLKITAAHFMSIHDKLPMARVERAFTLLEYTGHKDRKIKGVVHPDASKKEKAFVLTKLDGTEL